MGMGTSVRLKGGQKREERGQRKRGRGGRGQGGEWLDPMERGLLNGQTLSRPGVPIKSPCVRGRRAERNTWRLWSAGNRQRCRGAGEKGGEAGGEGPARREMGRRWG